MSPEFLVSKKIVIIGGTAGIGLAAAKAFAKWGAKMVLVGLREISDPEDQKLLADAAEVIIGDARDEKLAARAIEASDSHWGGFDGLFHVAGGSGRRMGDGPLHELTREGWDKTMELNLTTTMLSNQAAVQYFLKHNQPGAILNIGSVLGYSPSPQFFSTHGYAAAKSAIIGFTKSIAAYYATQNIRVNMIAPGLIETPMSQRAVNNPEIMEFVRTKQPLDGGRVGQPDDLIGLAAYCLSDFAKFTTGQIFTVDGGWHLA